MKAITLPERESKKMILFSVLSANRESMEYSSFWDSPLDKGFLGNPLLDNPLARSMCSPPSIFFIPFVHELFRRLFHCVDVSRFPGMLFSIDARMTAQSSHSSLVLSLSLIGRKFSAKAL